MPSAFICIEKYFYKKIKKTLGISKAIRAFESPLCIWQSWECSLQFFRVPWTDGQPKITLPSSHKCKMILLYSDMNEMLSVTSEI